MGEKEALCNLFRSAIADISTEEKYYINRRRNAKTISYGIRIIAIVFFFSGTVSPIISPLFCEADRIKILHLGYAALAISGPLMFVDRFLLGSSG